MAGVRGEAFERTVEQYRSLHDDRASNAELRRERYDELIDHYYNLVTDFYMFGWGERFHFAPRRAGEGFQDSLRRHERFVAEKIGLQAGMEALDVGCGVGGPARHLARQTGAHIVGLNDHAYQIERAEKLTRKRQLEHLVRFVKGDYMQVPFEADRFDAVYIIEASCHAPDRVQLFEELMRVMKPGALLAGYDWCLTDRYDDHDPDHRRIKKDIEVGSGLPELCPMHVVDTALKRAGLELLETYDRAPESSSETPWYLALTGQDRGLMALPRKPVGRKLTNKVTSIMERFRLAPRGTREVSDFLNASADALVGGGRAGVFTPMYYFLARKPGGA
jgi:sterol 24-C-methyltransferase